MSAFSGEYLGFTLGDFHSSQLNITRVSNGNRYSENLTPNFVDHTTTIIGNNQTYFFNSDHTQKPFTIDFAFDDLREEDIRQLRQILGFNGVKQLIFDETSYKKYYVKCSQPPVLKFVPFGELGDVINYKGEGVINLVAYFPYGISTREIVIQSGTKKNVSNIGDIETPLKIYYKIDSISKNISLSINEKPIVLQDIKRISDNDSYICVNTKTHLVEGLDASYNKTGILYNSFISSGDFYFLPVGQNILTSNLPWESIKFNYLYY